MRWLVLKAIGRLGRWAAVLISICGLGLFYAWFQLWDGHFRFALLTLPLILPVAMGSAVLLIGTLLSGWREPKGVYPSPAEAPGLWTIWNELMPPKWWQRRQLLIDDQLNASIGERARVFGLGFPVVTMTVGLPLLHSLDVAMVRAVVAHEVGHAT